MSNSTANKQSKQCKVECLELLGGWIVLNENPLVVSLACATVLLECRWISQRWWFLAYLVILFAVYDDEHSLFYWAMCMWQSQYNI